MPSMTGKENGRPQAPVFTCIKFSKLKLHGREFDVDASSQG